MISKPIRLADNALTLWADRLALRTLLADADRALIGALPNTPKQIRRGHDIVRLGECVTSGCLVMSGVVARYGQTLDGSRELTALYLPGDMADLHSVMLPDAQAALTALSDVSVLRVPHADILAAAERSPQLAKAFWRDCTVDAAIAGEWLLSIGQRDARQRLAHLLCELGTRYEAVGYSRHRFPLLLNQTQLGEALGITAVHINRTVRSLREDGLLTVIGQTVTIDDWDRLCRVGEFDKRYLHLHVEPR